MIQDPKTVTVELEYPIEHEGKTISSLTFRRMKAKDSLVAEDTESQARAGIALFAALAGVNVAVIEELDLEDFQTLAKAVEPLMGKVGAAALDALKAHQE